MPALMQGIAVIFADALLEIIQFFLVWIKDGLFMSM